MTNILCVIPSRMGSTRIPRKPLLPIQGKPMIQWVYENASRCKFLNKVIVATDDEAIASLIRSINGNAMMTDPKLPTGSDRVAYVARHFPEADVIINLQGDEPFIKPSMLELLVSPYLKGESPAMTTLASPLDPADHTNPGIPKVVTDLKGNALYFSRAPIPYYREATTNVPVYHHMGVYAFKRETLLQFTMLAQTPLEKTESLEQLRALENGLSIRICVTQEKTLEINTLEEYERAQSFVYAEV